jgi:hypothetical protein
MAPNKSPGTPAVTACPYSGCRKLIVELLLFLASCKMEELTKAATPQESDAHLATSKVVQEH